MRKTVRSGLCLVAVLILLSPGCKNELGQAPQAPDKSEPNIRHPVITMDVITIPSSGRIAKIDGDAFVRMSDSARFLKARPGMTIGNDDVLSLHPGASIEIEFEDGSSFKHSAKQKDKWFAFKHED